MIYTMIDKRKVESCEAFKDLSSVFLAPPYSDF